ncbi:anillin/rhotekin rtkn [Anaeramoeba flamelloides]|uniref:Anillin/rhotekin rtkn n=1 Tax=Anaeramoeba flamelloides TaxID=1746091 RepID=A0ABQ8ZDY9_9EUKA|nr:anillin/rhotekin rtkn [Anaeramoeba flamelloides]
MGRGAPNIGILLMSQLLSVVGDTFGQRVNRVNFKKSRKHMMIGVTIMSSLQIFILLGILEYSLPTSVVSTIYDDGESIQCYKELDVEFKDVVCTKENCTAIECPRGGPITMFKLLFNRPILFLNGAINIVYYTATFMLYKEPLGLLFLVLASLTSSLLISPINKMAGSPSSTQSIPAYIIIIGIAGSLMCIIERQSSKKKKKKKNNMQIQDENDSEEHKEKKNLVDNRSLSAKQNHPHLNENNSINNQKLTNQVEVFEETEEVEHDENALNNKNEKNNQLINEHNKIDSTQELRVLITGNDNKSETNSEQENIEINGENQQDNHDDDKSQGDPMDKSDPEIDSNLNGFDPIDENEPLLNPEPSSGAKKEKNTIQKTKKILAVMKASFRVLIPYSIQAVVEATWFVAQAYFNNNCRMNVFTYTSLDQVLLPFYLFPFIILVDSIKPLRKIFFSGKDTEENTVTAFKNTLKEANWSTLFFHRLFINSRAVIYYYLAILYNINSVYLEVTFIRVVLSWLAAVILCLVIPKMIGTTQEEKNKIISKLNLILKTSGTALVVASLVILNTNK